MCKSGIGSMELTSSKKTIKNTIMIINEDTMGAPDAPKNKQAGKSKNENLNAGEDDLINDEEADDEDDEEAEDIDWDESK